MSTVIRVENVSKAYRLGLIGGGTLQEDFARWWARLQGKPDPNLKIGQGHHARLIGQQFWALDNVSFEVKEGEVLGIIGRNGAGKSTLLKILSQVTTPTSGQIKIKGRIASLLEVGTGFHPELTGRENVFLNGAILGMTKAEIRNKFDEIVAFSGVEEFIDTPVKRYSSGMYVRLAFAVAAHLEPEILIVDEVLAVGDAEFQKKCLGKMQDASGKEGRTVLFVSHNMGMITQLCSNSILLENGTMAMMGPTEDVVSRYMRDGAEMESERTWNNDEHHPGNSRVRLNGIRVTDSQGCRSTSFDIRRPICVEIHYEVFKTLSSIRLGLSLSTTNGIVVFSSADSCNVDWRNKARKAGRYVSRCEIPGNLLNEGKYVVTVGADVPSVEGFFLVENAIGFHVEQTGGPGSHDVEIWQGVVCPDLNWDIEYSDESNVNHKNVSVESV